MVISVSETHLPEPSQQDIDYFSKHVYLSYTVEDNLVTGDTFGTRGYFLASLSLHNTGNLPVPSKQWQLYGYFMRLVEPSSYPYFNGFYIHSCDLKIYHVQGSLYKFTPAGDYFSAIQPGEYRTCVMKVDGFQVAKTDSMPNWYVTGNDVVPRIITNTQGEDLTYVGDLTEEHQYKRRKDDPSSPLSAVDRYAMHGSFKEQEKDVPSVIPTPLIMKMDNSKTISWNTETWRIVDNKNFTEEIKYLAGKAAGIGTK